MPRGYFFTAVLALNNHGEIALFEVKLKRKTHGTSTVSIYLVTSDIPPLPVGSDDVLRIAFYLENSIGTTPIRIKMAEASFLGHFLDGKAVGQNTCSLRTEGAEWQFAKMYHAAAGGGASSSASSTSSISSSSSSTSALSSAAATASSGDGTAADAPATGSSSVGLRSSAASISTSRSGSSSSSSSASSSSGPFFSASTSPSLSPISPSASSPSPQPEFTWYVTAVTLKVPEARAKEYISMSKSEQ